MVREYTYNSMRDIVHVCAMNEDNGMKDILCINVGKLNTDTSVNLFQTLIRERTGVTHDHHLDNFFLFLVI